MKVVRHTAIGALAAALLLLGLAAPAGAASVQLVGTFSEPIYVTSDPGDANRLFVVERRGLVKEVEGAAVTDFADLSAAVGCEPAGCEGERGLLSIALAPDFDLSGRLFADFAGEPDGAIHVVELLAGGGSALGATPRTVLEIPHPGAANHNGGQLQLGPEGDLFVSTGDGGGAGDEFHNAQDLESLLGKILRIDPTPGGGYTVPAGNPFPGATPPYDTIWSYGLRNPFRFSFDRAGGGVWIGDVGQGAREEVDFSPAPGFGRGADYGWNCREGTLPGPASDPQCGEPGVAGFTEPVFDYPHSGASPGAAEGCAVIGGYVVRDASLGALYGRYLYGDHCSGELRSFDPAAPRATDCFEGLDVGNLDSFGEDAAGRVYAVSGDGAVWRLVPSTPSSCGEPPAAAAPAAAPLRPAYAGIKAYGRRIQRGKRALITVWISPCAQRRGERIRLFRGRHPLGSRRLSRACTARFRPRIRRRSNFRSRIEAGAGFEAATSRRLTIKPRRARRRHQRAQRRARQ